MNEQSDTPTGRDAVRTLLIEPLRLAGLVRQRKFSAKEHDAQIQKMIERLAYMRPDNLATLCETVIDNAVGDRATHWPVYASVWKWARRIQTPPDNERHIMNSWLRSVEGPIAKQGGYLAELYLWLKKHGRPPSDYDIERIREEAKDRVRRRERGGLRDREEMEYFARVERHCLDLVEDGKSGREQGQAA
jgi:hypothetical protein